MSRHTTNSLALTSYNAPSHDPRVLGLRSLESSLLDLETLNDRLERADTDHTRHPVYQVTAFLEDLTRSTIRWLRSGHGSQKPAHLFYPAFGPADEPSHYRKLGHAIIMADHEALTLRTKNDATASGDRDRMDWAATVRTGDEFEGALQIIVTRVENLHNTPFPEIEHETVVEILRDGAAQLTDMVAACEQEGFRANSREVLARNESLQRELNATPRRRGSAMQSSSMLSLM